MTHEQADELCAHLARTHPDRHTHRWMVRPRESAWEVVKVGLPPVSDPAPGQLAEERPQTPDDPRSPHVRNVGGPYGPI